MESKPEKLSISASPSSATRQTAPSVKTKPQPSVTESWEDEILDTSSDDDTEPLPTTNRATDETESHHLPAAPPPTPIGPSLPASQLPTWDSLTSSSGPSPRANTPTERRRPEKSTAVAARMIAAGLGRSQKRTEEQKQYDQAVRKHEIKRKNFEKEKAERERVEDEKAINAVWEDG